MVLNKKILNGPYFDTWILLLILLENVQQSLKGFL